MVKISTNFYQHLDTFLFEKKAQGLSPASIDSYEFTANKFLKFADGRPITKALYYEFINAIDVKGETKKHYGRELRVFLYWLMNEGIIEQFKICLPKSQEPVPRIPTKEEVERLITRHTNTFTQERMKVICNLVVSTGIRARTIVNLKVSDISFEQQQLLLRETKSKRATVIPLNDTITMILKKYVRKYKLEDWLFPTETGKQFTTEGLGSSYERYAIKCNCSQHGIHSLRHYFATEATRAGMSPFVLQRVLQHSDLKVTLRYVNLVNNDIKNEMQLYNPLKWSLKTSPNWALLLSADKYINGYFFCAK